MKIPEKELFAVIGDDNDIRFVLKDRNGTAVSLLGAIVEFSVKDAETDSNDDALIYRTSEYNQGVNILDPPSNGICEVVIPPELTESLSSYNYYWDLKITFASGKVKRPIKGRYVLDQSVTK